MEEEKESKSRLNLNRKDRSRSRSRSRSMKVVTRWHKPLINDWKEHFKTDFEESKEEVDIEIGVTFDQKLLYLSCHILALVGPTVQITFIVAISLFFLSESLFYTHCKVRNRPVFFDEMPWNSWILRHGGLSDAILGWHYVLVYTLQTVLGVLILCDQYVFLIHLVTREKLMHKGHCIHYSDKQFKTLVFLPLWFALGVFVTGSARQQKTERQNVSAIADWCMKIEIVGLMYLGLETWLEHHSIRTVAKEYRHFNPDPVIHAIPLAIIILHQYWINIPKTFGKQKGLAQGCSGYSMRGVRTVRLTVICVFLGLIQPFYLPYKVFHEMLQNCLPFWLAIKTALPLTSLFTVRCIHIIASIYTGMHFASRALVDLAKSDLTIHWFLKRNPMNGVRIVAITFVALLAGVISCVITLETMLALQGLNIIFSRAILSLSILLRERYSRPVDKVLQSAYKEDTEDIQVDLKVWRKISAENSVVFVFFVMAIIGLLGLAAISNLSVPGIVALDMTNYLLLAFLGLALSPLLYIMTLTCVKKPNDANSPSKWEIFICTIMYLANVYLCIGKCMLCTPVFLVLLLIGFIFYLLAFHRRKALRKNEGVNEKKTHKHH